MHPHMREGEPSYLRGGRISPTQRLALGTSTGAHTVRIGRVHPLQAVGIGDPDITRGLPEERGLCPKRRVLVLVAMAPVWTANPVATCTCGAAELPEVKRVFNGDRARWVARRRRSYSPGREHHRAPFVYERTHDVQAGKEPAHGPVTPCSEGISLQLCHHSLGRSSKRDAQDGWPVDGVGGALNFERRRFYRVGRSLPAGARGARCQSGQRAREKDAWESESAARRHDATNVLPDDRRGAFGRRSDKRGWGGRGGACSAKPVSVRLTSGSRLPDSLAGAARSNGSFNTISQMGVAELPGYARAARRTARVGPPHVARARRGGATRSILRPCLSAPPSWRFRHNVCGRPMSAGVVSAAAGERGARPAALAQGASP